MGETMEKIKFLYRVRDGKLISTKITKETPKLYWIADSNFDWRSNYLKDHACITPEQAIQEEYNRAIESMGMRRDLFKRSVKRFLGVKKLKSEL
jgi:hypothetical protein